MVSDSSSGKPCGYAFLEYEHERDMHGKLVSEPFVLPSLCLRFPVVQLCCLGYVIRCVFSLVTNLCIQCIVLAFAGLSLSPRGLHRARPMTCVKRAISSAALQGICRSVLAQCILVAFSVVSMPAEGGTGN